MENKTKNPTGIKQLFQSLIPESENILEGFVLSINPLSIQGIKNDKLLLKESVLLLPKHLTDYEIEIELSVDSGGKYGLTSEKEGHAHDLLSVQIKKGKIMLKNALKIGEQVYLLPCSGKYFILGRIGDG